MSFSLLSRSYSTLRTSSLSYRFVSRTINKEFNWQKLNSPWTNPSFALRMRELEAKFNGMKSELKGVPKSIEPIDWASWEKSISEPGLVAQIRKEYESLNFAKVKGQDLTQINIKLDHAIKRTSENAEISKTELTKLREQLKLAQEEKNEAANWQFQDWLNRYPGLDEQLKNEWFEGYQLPTDAEDRIADSDVAQLRQQFKSNQPLTVDTADVSPKVGTFDVNEQLKQVEELEKKMFGDNPLYQKYAAELRDKEAKAKVKAEAAHHH